MSTQKEKMDEAIEFLNQQRDELKLKIHLAKQDAKDELEKLEVKLSSLKSKAKQIEADASEASEDIQEAAMALVNEIKDGFEKVKSHF
ncbi:conserved hypothetical protein [Chloroherpeton thalassium ATCC 35110]|uniref:Uncharacterized protein n=1 Tax=Chloroherpeton thalassium (strain ATCC 35110 / GB-78) TaxID=517418 RepID=B3QZ26_CHLT3|nr:hypothetical protein [Chloroherpeton thalassium]ACF13719.1 conserved hypothetical protein [Chloroherpeton thalassium ATCC 35110]